MKTNLFSKIAVTMMTVALGAGVVGSISGTVAWFQYSTRSTVAFTGTAAHCTENLQIRVYNPSVENEWKSDLDTGTIAAALKATTIEASGTGVTAATITKDTFISKVPHGGTYVIKFDGSNWVLGNTTIADINTYGIAVTGTPVLGDTLTVKSNVFDTLKPVTSGELAEEKVAANLYRNPIYQYPSQTSWKTADQTDYVILPLELRVKDVDGETTPTALAKKIYVSNMDMAVEPVTGKKDITSALRVAVSTSNNGTAWADYGTFSKDGAAVQTYGKLDLNGQDGADTFGDYSWNKGPEILYGLQYNNLTSAITTGAGLSNLVVKADWFMAKVNAAADTYEFIYASGTGWTLNGNPAVLSQYGISVDGTPTNADVITVTVPDDSTAHPNKAESFDLNPVASGKGIADDSDPYDIKGDAIGVTTATATLRVNLKIYLEGWKQLGDPASAIWDAKDFVGAGFNLGVRFSAEAHSDH